MFRSIKTEIENDMTVRVHLTNAAQKDLFILNYKQRLISFLNSRFGTTEFDVETFIDPSDKNDFLYSDDQKYTYLASKYPELKEFRKIFNLDIT